MIANSVIANSYGTYKEIVDSFNSGHGCSPKEYGQYLQSKNRKLKGNTKPLKRGMRK